MDYMERKRQMMMKGEDIVRNEKMEIKRQVRLAQLGKMAGYGIGLELCSASLSYWL
jgi:hypothetical protein